VEYTVPSSTFKYIFPIPPGALSFEWERFEFFICGFTLFFSFPFDIRYSDVLIDLFRSRYPLDALL